MCGRFIGNPNDAPELAQIYRQSQQHYPSAVLKSGEIFPTEMTPILFGGALLAVPARWGFPAKTGKGVLINARAETVQEKISFRDSVLNRRCVIPTTGYFEWDAQHNKYRIRRPNEKMLYLGGFCKRFEDGARYVILTTAPNDSVRSIHNRMPLILGNDGDSLKRWNEDTAWALGLLQQQMPQLSPELIS